MLSVTRLESKAVLRERIGEIKHPKHGKVTVSRTFNGTVLMFEFQGGVYHAVSVEDLAGEVFRQIDETRGGVP